MIPPPPRSTLFPYTTLFRSVRMQRESNRALADLAWPQHPWIASSVGLPTLVIGAGRDAFFPLPMIEEAARSEEHTSELQSQSNLVCRLLLEKKKKKKINIVM